LVQKLGGEKKKGSNKVWKPGVMVKSNIEKKLTKRGMGDKNNRKKRGGPEGHLPNE